MLETPRSLYIEITNRCNFTCTFCPWGESILQKKALPSFNMERSLFETIILEASQNKIEQIYLHVLGEPTLHPDFLHFLNTIEKTNLKINLTTNGATIEKWSDTFFNTKNLRQINFSTHAYAEREEKEALQQLQKILDFSKKSQEVRPDLYINLRLWNVGDEPSKKWNTLFLNTINRFFHTAIELQNFCSRHKSFLVENRIYLHNDSRFIWPYLSHDTPEKVKGTCRALKTHIAILHDGRVIPCCLDYQGIITLGNMATESLFEILQKPITQNLWDGFQKNELRHALCKSCSFCKRFKTL